MQNDETVVDETTTTDETEVEIKEGQDGAAEDADTEVEDESGETDTTTTTEKLTYEQKLARATTPEEKFAIADAEANKNRRLLKKSAKTEKPMVTKPKAPQTASPEPTVEETVLLANGMPEELVTELKVVAKARGLKSLIKAQTDPIFVAVKEKFEKDKKRKDASLGASRGAGGVKPQKNFHTPGLSRDEHKKMMQDALK